MALGNIFLLNKQKTITRGTKFSATLLFLPAVYTVLEDMTPGWETTMLG